MQNLYVNLCNIELLKKYRTTNDITHTRFRRSRNLCDEKIGFAWKFFVILEQWNGTKLRGSAFSPCNEEMRLLVYLCGAKGPLLPCRHPHGADFFEILE
jgi:hypothetical protein